MRNKRSRQMKKRAAGNLVFPGSSPVSHARVLIVCEGEKTEPNYFKGLRKSYGLDRANVEILGSGANPTSVVQQAMQEFRKNQKTEIPFNKVFCVFDKNSHTDYERALAQLKNKENFEAITSVPCFEYWLLLHYCKTDRPYKKMGQKSACDQVITDLKEYLGDYTKGQDNTFRLVQENMQFAQKNAEQLFKTAKSRNHNPHTDVHQLVQYLQNFKK